VIGIFVLNNKTDFLVNFKSRIFFFNIFILVILLIGTIEVVYGLTYSFTYLSSGKVIYRSGSTFFNPNLYSLWCASVYFILAYVYWTKPLKRNLLIIPMILITYSIYLTGSRGVFLLLLFCMFLVCILLPKNRFRFMPIIIFSSSFLAIFCTSVVLQYLNIGVIDFTSSLLIIKKSLTTPTETYTMNYAGVKSMVFLGERFINAPTEVLSYIVTNMRELSPGFDEFMFEYLSSAGHFFENRIRSETKLSLDLRFNLNVLRGEGGDSGWLNIIKNYSFITFLTILFQHLFLLFWGFKLQKVQKSINSSVVIGIQIFLILINFTLKFYAFPFVILTTILHLFSILLLINQTLIQQTHNKRLR
ncbi:hypothetical protein N9Z35_07285, partial [Alphaproteobacteria bacterium]|nr:hypothetical protein [Alphaproteobacteria bacterium]